MVSHKRGGAYGCCGSACGVWKRRASGIDKVGSDVHDARPLNRVRADKRDIVGAEQIDEFFHKKTGMANFEGVAQRLVRAQANIDAFLYKPCVVMPCD